MGKGVTPELRDCVGVGLNVLVCVGVLVFVRVGV